jgi:hypothetical protein
MNGLGMKLYTVHVKPGASAQAPIFVREGFNIFAFLFHFLWALYYRLWGAAVVIFVVNAMLVMLVHDRVLSDISIVALQLGFQFLVGAHGNDWLRARLARDGYVTADIAAGESLLRAEQRYFERYLNPAGHA